ncbi:thiamine-phosphate kinase [Azotosporobacter soli]|uniref:thiamine-phosphate kinase n=1 Tax=Azotosporobacter soli TaxID=3055040 RepID=UPI0031FF017F
MDIRQIGEFGLIERIREDAIVEAATVVAGIGDDAAVVLATPKHFQLLTTDMLVESVHFDLSTISPWQLGYKAIAVNLSDIAAMGGIPRQVLISLALPSDVTIEFVDGLYQGIKEICRQHVVNIVGGDTVSSPNGIVINVVVLGEVEPAYLQRRSGANAGDLIVVTGNLGDSSAGLELLQRGRWEEFKFAWPLVTSHLTPRPHLKEGRVLAAHTATSMNDISDGLASEANEIANASQVCLRIDAERIPVSTELREAAIHLGKDSLEYALYGGEDYKLLATLPPEALAAVSAQVDVTVIGVVEKGEPGVFLLEENGALLRLEAKGYNHFRQNEKGEHDVAM